MLTVYFLQGDHPIKGANELIQYLDKSNIKCMISTNECDIRKMN